MTVVLVVPVAAMLHDNEVEVVSLSLTFLPKTAAPRIKSKANLQDMIIRSLPPVVRLGAFVLAPNLGGTTNPNMLTR